MQIKEVINSLNLQLLTHTGDMQAEVTGGYASDLLSNVMGQAEPGMVWVTMQGHQNVAAVASLISECGCSGIFNRPCGSGCGRRRPGRRRNAEKSRCQ